MPDTPRPLQGEIVLYQTEDGRTRVECRFAAETLWLSQALIAELFRQDVRTINEHLQNIYEEGELDPVPTIRRFRIVRREGARDVAREIEHYNDGAVLPDKGKIKRADADARAEAEYEEFAARRRAMLEAEGQRDRQEALEDAAKKLPGKPKLEAPKE
ncbi:MAG: hypothetical protein ACLP9L_14275 [Thermoguttaceae bacterium]